MAAFSTILAVSAIASSAFSAAKSLTAKAPKAPGAPTLPAAPDPAIAQQERQDMIARVRRQRGGVAASGRTATLLTGASGLPGAAPSATKTLLGS
jgi:hypothetical protein